MTATTASEVFDGLGCNGCGARLNVPPGERTARCPYCASPNVVMRPRSEGADPTFVVGFVVTEDTARARAREWIRGAWFAPGAFRRSDVTAVRGVYVPAYLYSAAAHVAYTASIGENYTVIETYTTTDAKGRTVTRTRTKTVTEWRSLAGRWASYVEDVFVTASKGLHNTELEAVEPFDTRALRRYSTKLLSGWIAEDPSMDARECMTLARNEAVAQVGKRLSGHMPGDSHRRLKYSTDLEYEDLELLLLPVWILAVKYEDDAPLVRLVINGQTGKLIGRRPRSWLKILVAVLGVASAIALTVFLAGGVS
ncbi:MAG: hypothetical protein AAF721_17960 [Myxococcota bacterium]